MAASAVSPKLLIIQSISFEFNAFGVSYSFFFFMPLFVVTFPFKAMADDQTIASPVTSE